MEDNDQYREAVRTGLAKGLAATARGLSAASRALASTSRQLRPPEAADPWGEGADPTTEAPADADLAEDANELAGQNVRDILSQLDDLTEDELRALRDAEADGKARKTVLQAVDKLLAQ